VRGFFVLDAGLPGVVRGGIAKLRRGRGTEEIAAKRHGRIETPFPAISSVPFGAIRRGG